MLEQNYPLSASGHFTQVNDEDIEQQLQNKGFCKFEGGLTQQIDDGRYKISMSRQYVYFKVNPMGAPRMTQSDKWKINPNHADPTKRQRPAMKRYFQFKDTLFMLSLSARFMLGNTIDAVYFLPMPESWSKKKKTAMLGMPCMTKPDTDNITKAVKDTLLSDDSKVWWEKAEKRWAYKGGILFYL